MHHFLLIFILVNEKNLKVIEGIICQTNYLFIDNKSRLYHLLVGILEQPTIGKLNQPDQTLLQ